MLEKRCRGESQRGRRSSFPEFVQCASPVHGSVGGGPRHGRVCAACRACRGRPTRTVDQKQRKPFPRPLFSSADPSRSIPRLIQRPSACVCLDLSFSLHRRLHHYPVPGHILACHCPSFVVTQPLRPTDRGIRRVRYPPGRASHASTVPTVSSTVASRQPHICISPSPTSGSSFRLCLPFVPLTCYAHPTDPTRNRGASTHGHFSIIVPRSFFSKPKSHSSVTRVRSRRGWGARLYACHAIAGSNNLAAIHSFTPKHVCNTASPSWLRHILAVRPTNRTCLWLTFSSTFYNILAATTFHSRPCGSSTAWTELNHHLDPETRHQSQGNSPGTDLKLQLPISKPRSCTNSNLCQLGPAHCRRSSSTVSSAASSILP